MAIEQTDMAAPQYSARRILDDFAPASSIMLTPEQLEKRFSSSGIVLKFTAIKTGSGVDKVVALTQDRVIPFALVQRAGSFTDQTQIWLRKGSFHPLTTNISLDRVEADVFAAGQISPSSVRRANVRRLEP